MPRSRTRSVIVTSMLPFDWLTNRQLAPRIFDNACLALIEMPKPATTATTYVGQLQAVSAVLRFAQAQIKPQDRERFIEVVETQLLSLHEGSIARYRLRPSEFQVWQAHWK